MNINSKTRCLALTLLSLVSMLAVFVLWDISRGTVDPRAGEPSMASLFPQPFLGVVALVLWGTLYWLYRRVLLCKWKPRQGWVIATGLMLSLSIVVGQCFYTHGNWDHLVGSGFGVARGVVGVVGLGILFYACLLWCFNRVDDHLARERHDSSKKGRLRALYASHPTLVSAAVVLLCWLPILIVYFPGSVGWDGFAQINQYFGVRAWSEQHPVPVSLLMGFVVSVGRAIHSDNLGLFLYILLQVTICVLVYGLCSSVTVRLGGPMLVSVISLAFYALCPIWAGYAQQMYKDTLFAAFFALTIAVAFAVLRKMRQGKSVSTMQWVLLCVAGTATCLFRKNGVHAVLPLLVAALWYAFCKRGNNRGYYKRVALASCVVLALWGGISHVARIATNAAPDGPQEVLSVPLQQTARYLKEHPADVLGEELATIDKVVDAASLASRYNPNLSDPVKGTFKKSATNKDMEEYFVVWRNMLLRHPDCYAQATIANTYGYFFPIGVFDTRADRYLIGTAHSNRVNKGNMDFYYANNKSLRNSVTAALNEIPRLPVIGLFVNAATYVWVLIVVVCYAISRKKTLTMILCLPCVITLGICMLSPVNGCVRYVLPIMAALPVVIASACLQSDAG